MDAYDHIANNTKTSKDFYDQSRQPFINAGNGPHKEPETDAKYNMGQNLVQKEWYESEYGGSKKNGVWYAKGVYNNTVESPKPKDPIKIVIGTDSDWYGSQYGDYAYGGAENTSGPNPRNNLTQIAKQSDPQ